MANEIILSADKTRQLLHISKRKCAWMLKNGIIPCKISVKKTRCYEVRLSDVKKFVKASAAHPENYVIPSIFSSKSIPEFNVKYPTPPENFHPWLETYWESLSDQLTTADVAAATGYATSTVNMWQTSGKLRTVIVRCEPITALPWLIDFMCGQGWRIAKKSKKHWEMMNEYLKVN